LPEDYVNEPDSYDQKGIRLSLQKTYSSIRPAIDAQLSAFAAVWECGDDHALWREMCFCTCTPQTNAHRGWAAASELSESGLLTGGSVAQTAAVLRGCGVRFHNNKAHYIVQNRDNFYPHTKRRLAKMLVRDDPQRELYSRVAGWGMKEAAHFMRNIGFGHIACILDRHILRQLVRCGVIPEIPRTLPVSLYHEIDLKMKHLAQKIEIPLAALDLVFWFEETGEIFK
jgi:N-glycosylase/DNA lyase